MQGRKRVILSTVIAALGGLLFGFDTAVISGTTESLRSVFDLSSGWLGFVVASALIGTIMGSVAVGAPSDKYGRKRVLMALGCLYFVSAIGSAMAWNLLSFVILRFIGGLAVGGSSVVSPMYIAEISPAKIRGRLVAVSQFNVVLGILLAYFSNYIIGSHVLPGTDSGLHPLAWRWMFGVEAVPAALFFILLFRIPYSPRWLIKQHRRDEALAVLQKMGAENPEGLVAEIVESLHEETVSTDEPFFCRKYRLPILLAFMVASFNQWAGINALIYYTTDIFKMAGAGQTGALAQAVAIGFTNLIFTIIAMSVIDKFGRKKLLLIGSVGLAVCLGTVAYAFYSGVGGKLVLVALIGYIAFFAFSQGSVIWVFISEIFPNRVRARGQALGSFTHWFWCAVVSWSFPMIAEKSGGHAFSFYAAMMVLQFILVMKYMPETKGISLENIQKKLGIE